MASSSAAARSNENQDELENVAGQISNLAIEETANDKNTSNSNEIVPLKEKTWKPAQPTVIRCFCGRRHGLEHKITIQKYGIGQPDDTKNSKTRPICECPCGEKFITLSVIGTLYYDLVKKRSNSHQKVIVGPLKTVLDHTSKGLNYWNKTFQGSIDKLNGLISQNEEKKSYNYLFLRPPQKNISITALTVDELVDLVFYVGEGTEKRITKHISEVRSNVKSEINNTEKIDIIDRLWYGNKCFHIVKIFDGITKSESTLREAAMISAIGKDNLSNIINGKKTNADELSEKEKQECGACYMLEALEESKNNEQWFNVYQKHTQEHKNSSNVKTRSARNHSRRSKTHLKQ